MDKHLIEIITLLTVFASTVKQVTFKKLLIDKTCLIEYNFPKNICINLSNYHNVEEQIQNEVNNYQLYISIIMSVLNIIYIMFLGPWSDIYGRKMLIFMGILGFLLENIVIIINIILFNISINYLLLSAICPGITGGIVGLVTGTYSYVSDISIEKSRTLKFTVLEIFVKFSSPAGTLVGGIIYQHLHYLGVFGASGGLYLISMIIVIFLKESLSTENRNIQFSTTEYLKDIFNINNVKNMFYNCCHNIGRKEILLILSMFLGVISYIGLVGFSSGILENIIKSFATQKEIYYAGIAEIDFLYTERFYDWTVSTYSTVNSLFSVGSSILIIVFAYTFIKMFCKSDAFLGLVGFSSGILENIIKSFATRKEIYYAALACGMLSNISSVAIRTLLSKFISNRHIGSIFSLLAICESITPLFAGIIFLEAYNHMYFIFAGFVYLIAAFLLLFGFNVFIWLLKKISTCELPAAVSNTQETLPVIQYADECAVF